MKRSRTPRWALSINPRSKPRSRPAARRAAARRSRSAASSIARVDVMLAEATNAGKWAHDGEKFVDGTYRIECVACKHVAFASDVCPRCNAPDRPREGARRREPARGAEALPEVQRARAARDRAGPCDRALRRRRDAEAQAARGARRARLSRRRVCVRCVRSRGRRRGLPAVRGAGPVARASAGCLRSRAGAGQFLPHDRLPDALIEERNARHGRLRARERPSPAPRLSRGMADESTSTFFTAFIAIAAVVLAIIASVLTACGGAAMQTISLQNRPSARSRSSTSIPPGLEGSAASRAARSRRTTATQVSDGGRQRRGLRGQRDREDRRSHARHPDRIAGARATSGPLQVIFFDGDNRARRGRRARRDRRVASSSRAKSLPRTDSGTRSGTRAPAHRVDPRG